MSANVHIQPSETKQLSSELTAVRGEERQDDYPQFHDTAIYRSSSSST